MSVTYATRDEWLAARTAPCDDGMVPIHASEVPEILFGEPLKVYAQKIGLVTEDSYLMRRGRRMEAAIADEYAEQTGRPVMDLGELTVQQHREIPWLRATLDRVTIHEFGGVARHPLQIKLALGSAHEWKDGPPLKHQTQVQIEIACYGSSWGALAGLIGPGPLSVHDLARDDELVSLALPHLEKFRRQVRDREAPEPRSSMALEPLKRMWGVANGDTIELADPSVLDVVAAWERAKEAGDAAEEWRLESEARIRRMLTDASWAWLSDGSALVRRKWGKGEVLRREWPRRR